MKLHDLRPADGSRTPAHARRSRHRRRQGQDRRPRHEGPEGARRRLDPALVRGRPDPAPHADPEAARLQEPVQDRLRGREPRPDRRARRARRARVGRAARRRRREAPRPRRSPSTRRSCARPGSSARSSKPLKVLGQGDVEVALFVVADAFSKSAVAKIEAAGGSVQVLEVPTTPLAALGVDRTWPPDRASGRARPSTARPGDRRSPTPKAPGRRRRRPSGRGAADEATAAVARPRQTPTPTLPRPRPQGRRQAARPRPRRAARRAEAGRSGRPGEAARAPRLPPTRGRAPRRAGRPTADAEARQRRRPDRRRRLTVLESLLNAFRAPDIRRRLLFVAGILIVFRFLAHVPVPGRRPGGARSSSSTATRCSACSTCSRAAGCRRSRSSGSGVNPYINASIIMQLMTSVVPSLQALSREGEYGRNKINQYTRYLTVPLALLQAYGFLALLHNTQPPVLTGSFGLADLETLTQIITLTAGVGPPDVAGRADHREGHRQRHQLHHLRRHRGPRPDGACSRSCARRTSWRSSPSPSSRSPPSP